MFIHRWLDAFFGRGDYAVTVPPMDGPFMHNDAIDLMESVASLESPDNLIWANGHVWFSDGGQLYRCDGQAVAVGAPGAPITALAASRNGLWVCREDGLARLDDAGNATAVQGGPSGAHVTAMAEASDGSLYLAVGSARNPARDWRRDLMELNRHGEIHRRTPDGRFECIISGLGWAGGLMVEKAGSVIVSETWRHRLVRIAGGRKPEVLVTNLPFYPSRLAAASDGGAWLATYAGRGQLIEFVLRQHAYRKKMMEEVAEPWWIGPSFSSGKSFLEPIRGGTVKRMGQTKAWAPSNSYGLVVKLDHNMQPVVSLHSRADGKRHGVMSVTEAGGSLWLASRGNGEIVTAPLNQIDRLSRSQKERVQL